MKSEISLKEKQTGGEIQNFPIRIYFLVNNKGIFISVFKGSLKKTLIFFFPRLPDKRKKIIILAFFFPQFPLPKEINP